MANEAWIAAARNAMPPGTTLQNMASMLRISHSSAHIHQNTYQVQHPFD
jgi:hypothetical protein